MSKVVLTLESVAVSIRHDSGVHDPARIETDRVSFNVELRGTRADLGEFANDINRLLRGRRGPRATVDSADVLRVFGMQPDGPTVDVVLDSVLVPRTEWLRLNAQCNATISTAEIQIGCVEVTDQTHSCAVRGPHTKHECGGCGATWDRGLWR